MPAGFLIRAGISKIVPTSSPIIVEALALREAILMAYNLQWNHCVFELDNLQLIRACRKEISIRVIQAIVRDVLTLEEGFLLCGFLWTQSWDLLHKDVMAAHSSGILV
ncbi:Reverse transcriptase-like [Sesbania bispinosa]|nr:Reverse transcriptase-like [Sesbania bispinosa]